MPDLIDRDEVLIQLDKMKLLGEMEGKNRQYAKGIRDAMKLVERMLSVRIADTQTACGRDGGPGAAATREMDDGNGTESRVRTCAERC